MIRRIIRKNKKRRDPRYFLHEDLEEQDDETRTAEHTPAALKTPQEQSAESARQQAAQEDDKPKGLEVGKLTGPQEFAGAKAMLTFVNDLIAKMKMTTFTVNDLKQELETAGYAPEPEEGGTQTAAVTSPVEAPSVTGGLV